MRKKGKIKTWNTENAYGFIAPLHEGRDIFIHQKASQIGHAHPKPGMW